MVFIRAYLYGMFIVLMSAGLVFAEVKYKIVTRGTPAKNYLEIELVVTDPNSGIVTRTWPFSYELDGSRTVQNIMAALMNSNGYNVRTPSSGSIPNNYPLFCPFSTNTGYYNIVFFKDATGTTDNIAIINASSWALTYQLTLSSTASLQDKLKFDYIAAALIKYIMGDCTHIDFTINPNGETGIQIYNNGTCDRHY
jgi:hypothetical protein